MLRAGLVDGTLFKPYEAGLAELAARAPVPIVKQLGELLSVKGDDGPIVARLKRAGASVISMAAMESVIAGVRAIRAGKVLADPAADAGAKATAQQTVNSSSKTLQDAADGTLVPEGAHVVPKENADGTYSIAPVEGSKLPLAEVESPKFSDKAEAETQAATANGAIDEHLNAGKPIAPEALEPITDALKSGDAGKIAVAQDAPDLNTSIHDTPDETAALVKQLSDHFHDLITNSVASTGKMSVEESMNAAAEGLQQIPEDAASPVLKGLLKTANGQSISSMAADMVLQDKGKKIAKLLDAYEARPHDPILAEQVRTAVEQHADLRHTLYETEADNARRLRFIQERDAVKAQGVKYAGDAKPQTPETPAAPTNPLDRAQKVTRNPAGSTAAAVKTAREAIGDDAFRQRVDAEIAKRGGPTHPEVTMGATEDVARRITANPEAEGAKQAVTDARAELQKTGTNRDTNAVTATDFSLARAKAKMDALASGLENLKSDPDAAIALAKKIRTAADAARAEDITAASARDAAAGAPPKAGGNPIETLSKYLDEADAMLDKQMAPKTPRVQAEAPLSTTGPVSDFMKGAGQMTDAEAQNYARMVRMSGPLAPRNAEALAQATQIQRVTGSSSKALEYYVNNLLSGVKTWLTVANSAVVMGHFEPLVRMAAGVMTGNGALAREGADILYTNYKYFIENVSSAAMALREGRAITNPMPVHNAIDGTLGDVIRIPGRILTGLHEFATVTNYRSYIRASSLRAGREAGLVGDALSQYVEKDLGAAFDSKTGIATIPQGVDYAQGATFTKGLGNGTFGASYQELANNAWQVKMITPFVKIGSNIFKYGKSLTPWDLATNLVDGSKNGFNEATQVNIARAAVGSAMYASSMYAAHADMLTGAGPSDANLRSLWLADHQPYSVKVGDKWVSYQRIEPFSTMLGIVGDVTETYHESEGMSSTSEKIAYSLMSGITKDITNKTYFRGLAAFVDAVSSGDPRKMKAFVQTLAGGAVPYGSMLNQINPDDTYRNVRTTLDDLRSRIPGLSQTLDPQFNMFGEPTMKAPWYLNRSLNIATVKPTNPNSVESQLAELGKGLAPYPQVVRGTSINLSDRDTYDNGTGVSPYARLMQLVREPRVGPPLRDAMEDLVKSDRWKGASGTTQTDDFVNEGGMKLTLASSLKDRYEMQALQQVKKEYPKLSEAMTAVERAKAAAVGGGPDAQDRVNAILNRTK